MAAPERFAQTAHSFPLHRARRPYMALGRRAAHVRDHGECWGISGPFVGVFAPAYDGLRRLHPLPRLRCSTRDAESHCDAGRKELAILILANCPVWIHVKQLNPGPSGEDVDAVG